MDSVVTPGSPYRFVVKRKLGNDQGFGKFYTKVVPVPVLYSYSNWEWNYLASLLWLPYEYSYISADQFSLHLVTTIVPHNDSFVNYIVARDVCRSRHVLFSKRRRFWSASNQTRGGVRQMNKWICCIGDEMGIQDCLIKGLLYQWKHANCTGCTVSGSLTGNKNVNWMASQLHCLWQAFVVMVMNVLGL